MNLTSKNIQVNTFKVNVSCTREMITDLQKLKYLDSMFYEYKYRNVDETLIIGQYFILDYIEGDYAYYMMNDKILRKIKLLILSKSKISEILKHIMRESVYCSAEDVLTNKLSRELSKEIDIDIIKSLIKKNKII